MLIRRGQLREQLRQENKTKGLQFTVENIQKMWETLSSISSTTASTEKNARVTVSCSKASQSCLVPPLTHPLIHPLVCLPTHRSISLFIPHLPIHLPTHLPSHPSIHPSILPTDPYGHPSIHQSIDPSTHSTILLSIPYL